MKIVAGIIPPDSGQVVVGQTVKMGYYARKSTGKSRRGTIFPT